MDTEKAGDARFYTDASRRYPGVTSILDKADKPWLRTWRENEAAKLAVKLAPHLADMVAASGEEAVQKHLAGASQRHGNARRRIGDEAHDYFERILRGEDIGRVSPALAPYVKHFRQFLAEVNPEPLLLEQIACSDVHGYSGSFDALLAIWLDDNGYPDPTRNGRRLVVKVDWKTSAQAHDEVSLQLAGYRFAEVLIDPETDEESPMPDTDGAFVLHVTEKGWDFIPARADASDYVVFLALLTVFNWQRHGRKGALGTPIAGTSKRRSGTQRRKGA